MNYGMYLATSGVQTSMARLDVASNNLANSSTPGFRPDALFIQQRDVVRKEDHLHHLPSNKLLERLGGGVIPSRTAVVNADGPLRVTNQPLDVALQGDGFLAVHSGDGPEGVRLTRDGRLMVSPTNTLVRATDGAPVLAENGGVIRLDPTAQVTIDAQGCIEADGARVAKLRIATVPDPTSLIKCGSGLLRAAGGSRELVDGSARVVQRALEDAAVNPITSLMEATNAAKAAEANLAIVTAFNDTMGRAVNTLGRVT